MEIILEFIRSDIFLIIILFLVLILFIIYLFSFIKLNKTRKEYNLFLKKLGNGNNIEEILREYIKKVEEIEKENDEIIQYCQNINNNIAKCTQKIGIIRYNAFKDTGSDLSFTLALLNKYNDGIVLNGIYGRDASNIYAKPIEKGKSKYILSEEEKEAINKAINSF